MAEHDDADLRTAAKAAAATAAVGAAVGVARALAARAEDAANDDDEHEEEQEHEDEPVQVEDVEDEHDEPELADHDEPEPEPEPERVHEGTSVDRLRSLAEQARALLQELSSSDVESVSGIDRTRDGWVITLEAVEVRRIPESTDVMATYDVELDGDGDLVRYERRRRYPRAQSDGDGA